MGRLYKFIGLSPSEKLLFIRAIYTISYYRVALVFQPIQTILRRIQNKTRHTAQLRPSAVTPETSGRLIRAAGRTVPFSTCLSNTLAGHVLLNDYGYETRIHIGVAKDHQTGFAAHAWLTFEEEIIVGHVADLGKYHELPDVNDLTLR